MGHKQLSYEDRVVVYSLWKLGLAQASIARELGVNRSTISREIGWLKVTDKNYHYFELARKAHNEVMARKRASRSKAAATPPEVWQIVESKLRDEMWSPEYISGWLKNELPNYEISAPTIYRYIREKKPELVQYLRRKGKRRKTPWKGRKLRVPEPVAPKVSIALRTEAANNRTEIGHWEVDTVGSNSQSTILILTERLSRFSILTKILDKTAESGYGAIYRALKELPPQLRKSLTYDNGPENALHYKLNQELNTSSFFCAPYHSWQKGSVENRIWVLRLFFPKGTNFNLVSNFEIANVQYLLNYRPMKLHRFKFPADIFNCHLNSFLQKAA